MQHSPKPIPKYFLLIPLLLISQTLSDEFITEIADASDGSDYHEDSEQEILVNVKDLEQTMKIFPKVFLYITKDNCDYCRALDPVFEEVFRIIQKDQTCKLSLEV